MANHGHSNIRQPVVEDGKKLDFLKKIRRQQGAHQKMDLQHYIDMYPEMTCFWCNDLDGELQRWLDVGAQPIPASDPNREIFEGINDTQATKYVRHAVGTTEGGQTYFAFGLMMDPELYDEYKHAPERQRLADIDRSLYGGRAEADELGAVKSYAANLPTGSGKGYNQIK